MSTWQKRKEIASSKGTCPHHLNTLLTDGRCEKCDKNQARRLQRAAARNTCPNHSSITLVDGNCPQCVKNYEQRRDQRAAMQQCGKHSVSKINGVCPVCLEIKQKKIEISTEKGTCKRHPNLPLLLNGSCSECASYRIKLKLEKRCLQHPSVSIANDSCPICKVRYYDSKNLALSTGKCMLHPDEAAVTGLMCFDCWCASIAADALGSKKLKDVIKKSFTENPYCYFTGKLLVPGHAPDSASIDHIIPLSRGGSKTLDNIQWVQLILNVSKSNKTNAEFISEMKLISNNSFVFPQMKVIPKENMLKTPTTSNCSRCAKRNPKPAVISSYCYEHYFQAQALRHFNTVKVAKQLESMFLGQGGLCYFTRQLLLPGSSDPEHQPSLDHLVPTTRGGTSTIENVRWVTKRANTLKQNMTKEELIALAKHIAAR